jgi:hypothetical protein
LLQVAKESQVIEALQSQECQIREQEESDHSLSRSLSDLKDMLLPVEGVKCHEDEFNDDLNDEDFNLSMTQGKDQMKMLVQQLKAGLQEIDGSGVRLASDSSDEDLARE